MRSRKLLIIVSLVLVSLGIQLPAVNATVVKRLSDQDLVNQTQMVLTGTCTSIRSEWDEDGTKIFTYITISPQNFIKSDEAPQEITVQQLGGEVGDIGMHVDGVSAYEEGEEVILFLKKGRKGFHRTLGLSQGKFSIKTDPISQRKVLIQKRVRLVRTHNGKLEKKNLEIKSDKKKFLDEFTSRIQNILQRKNK